MKKSIFVKIMATFIIAMLCSFAVTSAISFFVNMQRISDESAQIAVKGAEVFYEYLSNEDITELLESETTPQYIKCREMMRAVCKGFNLSYLYLFTMDESTNTMRYIITAAPDDEMDELWQETRGFGYEVILDEYNNRAVINALHGNPDTTPDCFENEFGKVYAWYIPIKDADGSVIALIGAEDETENVLRATIENTVWVIILMTVLLIILFAIQLVFTYRKIFRPIKLISNRMNSFITDRESRMKPLGINSNDEIQEIADSFENMSADITKYIADIEAMTTERVQAGVELEVARRIQYGIVPEVTSLKESAFNAYAIAKPARSVGGDFYDCFMADNDKVCIIIGDVSGKGVAAALFMSMTKTMIRERLKTGMSPAETLNRTNDELCSSNPEGMFATVFAAVLDTANGVVTYANAGHTRPVITGGSTEFCDAAPGIALGLFDDAGIEDDELTLKKGQGIVLYTDGATEAVNSDRSFFGEDRLIEAVSGSNCAEDAVSRVENAVYGFSEGCEQFDDLTVLSLFYTGGDNKMLTLRPELAEIKIVKDAVDAALGDSEMKMKIKLACEEIFANIVSYSGAKSVEFLCERDGDTLTIAFADDGLEFNPAAAEEIDKDFEDFDMGGMGISIVKQIAKTLEYRRTDGKNNLTMKFAV